MKKLANVMEPFGGPIVPTEEMMNSATATMHTRSILQNGAAVVIFIAGLCMQAMIASAQSFLEGPSYDGFAEITLVTNTDHGRSLMHRPHLISTTTQLQR